MPAPTRRPDPETAGSRPRRPPGEIRKLLLEAGRAVFEEKGFARATTREITARAGVAETLLFRNFGTKATLFAEAVLQPLSEFFRRWIDGFTGHAASADPWETQYEFNASLYDMAVANRGLLLTFFATAAFEPEVLETRQAIDAITASLDELANVTEHEVLRRGLDLGDADIVLTSRIVVGAVVAMALFDSVLVPPGATREDLLESLTRQVLFGGLNLAGSTADMVPPVRRTRASRARSR